MIEASRDPARPVPVGTASGEPPRIPASRMDVGRLRDVHLLLWTHTGTARVEMVDGHTHRLAPGEGIWLPAGTDGRVRTDAGSVVFPYELVPTTVPSGPAGLVRFTVPDGWRDWLIRHYTHRITPVTSFGYTQDALLDVLAASRTTPKGPSTTPTAHDQPPMPTAPGARTVAEQIRANPALDRGIEEWAALAACSVSTLRRGFLATGLTFTQWRTVSRLAAAREFLAAGYGVERVAALVGFSSRNGFTRAFGDHHGITPRDYPAHTTDSADDSPERVAAERGSGTLARLIGQPTRLPAEPAQDRPLPAAQSALHTNDVHVLGWTYRGESYLRIGDTTYPRHRGDAIWIPAGVEHQAGSLEGSIAMPIGDLFPHDARVTEPVRTHFPPDWDAYLMHRSISLRTNLRPDGFDYRDILDVFREQFAIQRARAVPMPEAAAARDAATAFLRQMRTPPNTDLDPGIHEAFLRETGMTFTCWQNATRMRIARDLLDSGGKPTAVARRVGYTHLRNFTRAFTATYGVPPSRYRGSVSGSP